MLTLRPVTQLLLALKPRRRFAAFISRAVLSKEGGNKVLLSNFRAEDLRRSRKCACPAVSHEHILHPPRGSKERYREGQALAFTRVPHHIAFPDGKGRTLLVFSLFLLCNPKRVFQRLVPHSSVTEGGPCCLAICTIYPGDT